MTKCSEKLLTVQIKIFVIVYKIYFSFQMYNFQKIYFYFYLHDILDVDEGPEFGAGDCGTAELLLVVRPIKDDLGIPNIYKNNLLITLFKKKNFK